MVYTLQAARLVKRFFPLTLTLALACAPETGTQDHSATELDMCLPHDEGPACERERRVADRFDALRDSDPAALRALLSAMPKGGDLHSHLSGAVPTEKLIAWAIEDGLCVDAELKAIKCTGTSAVAVADVPHEKLLAAWSMAGFDGDVKEGHDHFFATFGRFGLVTRTRTADMLAAVRARAAEHNEQYLELMLPLGTSKAGSLAQSLLADLGGWDDEHVHGARAELDADAGFAANLESSAAELDAAIRTSEELLGCGTEQSAAGCAVEVRYLVQVWRAASRESVLGQIVYGFALAARDPRVAGINLAAAEDHPSALGGYADVMLAIGVLRNEDPSVHVALHAGELVPALLPADAQQHLGFHIREAVLTAGAERIGHGIDILAEESDELSSADLRALMSERGVAVEVCRSSNRFILGVTGPDHPMSAYLDSDVATVIATDDEGVSRSTLSDELFDAVVDHGLDYATTKRLVRDSLVHAFLPGESLFASTAVPALSDVCSSGGCGASERAGMQLGLERALAAFETAALAQ